MPKRSLRSALLLASPVGLFLSCSSVPPGQLFCDEWGGWGQSERIGWIAEVDEGARQAVRSDPGLAHWTEAEYAELDQCLAAGRGGIADRIGAACRAGVESVDEIGAIAASGVKPCMSKVLESPGGEMKARATCGAWRGWEKTVRAELVASMDETARRAFHEDPNVAHLSEDRHGAFDRCLAETRDRQLEHLDQSCRTGAQNSEEYFRGLLKERLKACMTEAMTGKADSKWHPSSEHAARPFCPDWAQWGARRRADFVSQGGKTAFEIDVITSQSPTAEQRTVFRTCYGENEDVLLSRLDAACETEITYEQAIQVIMYAAGACLREAGLTVHE